MDLNEKELEICNYIAEGYSNKEISEKMFISIHTVKTYIADILIKTGAKNRTHLAYLFGTKNL